MIEFLNYTQPPRKGEEDCPNFEVFINYQEHTWSCVLTDTDDEYDGTFSFNYMTGLIHLEWYGIPKNLSLWEAVEEELRSTITCNSR